MVNGPIWRQYAGDNSAKGNAMGSMRSSSLHKGMGLALLALCLCAPAMAQQRSFDDVEIKTTKLADGYYELEGAGGNIGLFVGEDGVFMVDDQFGPLAPKIRAAIKEITDQPVRFIVNTHYHPDHTGGNTAWAGMGAVIISHDNLRQRLEAQTTGDKPALGAAALPAITISDKATFHWNGETISLHHIPHAHTDGDLVVRFHNADVIQTGDIWRTVSYPRIDVNGGGSMKGLIAALDSLAAMGGPETRYVPGHGVVSSRADIIAVRDMMKTIWSRVADAKAAGKSLDETKAAAPTAEFDGKWATEALPGSLIVEQIYAELP